MGRLVMFSIGSICLGLVAAVGLAVYTAADPFEVGLGGAFTAASASRRDQPALVHCGSVPGPDGRAHRRKTLG
jgi:hypothetical protein